MCRSVWQPWADLCRTINGRSSQIFSNVRVYESNYRLEWMKHPEGDIRAARLWLMRIAEKFQPDVVHLNEYVYGDLDWGLPVVITGHSCVCA